MASWVQTLLFMSILFPALVECKIRHYHFAVVLKNATKLCATKAIVTINGKFPGPSLYAREGDNMLVRVTNHVQYNVTIHWHGVRQLRTGWSDGPAYITQCPIQPGQSFVYNFTLTGEWWKADTEAVVNQAMQTGLPPNISDAHTINGRPGPVPNCSIDGISFGLYIILFRVRSESFLSIGKPEKRVGNQLAYKNNVNHLTELYHLVNADAYTLHVETGKTYLLRVPRTNPTALLKADQGIGKYLIAISPFMDTIVAVDNRTGLGYLRYNRTLAFTPTTLVSIPSVNATPVTSVFSDSLRSLNSKEYPANVPLTVDHSLFFTIGVGINPCATCINGNRVVASINNVSFVMPTEALLQAHYYGINGVFTDDFPGKPLMPFNYTGTPPSNLQTNNGTKVYRLAYNATVQLVIQGNIIIAPESHPTHLHGLNFFVVGRGVGNFDPGKDPSKFNLVDPVEHGVWFFHCHLEVHTTWGLKMAFLVENGEDPNESIEPPPSDLPKC
ncbi:hypothetical protein V6N11_047104 [Hibiscus sabdariffa]|uniref:Laccase n=1 Tax=Hibiscus sabdariffa TaxID=183260 RepID=A0ABR2ADE7_9ROSI